MNLLFWEEAEVMHKIFCVHSKIYILKGSRTLDVPASTEMLSFFYFIIMCELVKCLCQISCVLYPLCNHSLYRKGHTNALFSLAVILQV
jgi:hypothetical protein